MSKIHLDECTLGRILDILHSNAMDVIVEWVQLSQQHRKKTASSRQTKDKTNLQEL